MPVGYHFTSDTLRDGRPIPAIGEKLVHDGPVEICFRGLHGSDEPFDALRYASGPILHRVEYAAPIKERTILATIDATHLLRRFAADQALSVAHLWAMPEIVREYLTTLDESTRAAAWVPEWGAPWDAAWDAARAAAWDAACNTEWDAARTATLDAAWAAAWDAARTATRDPVRDPSRPAAWGARSAAMDAARADFNARVYAAFGVEAA